MIKRVFLGIALYLLLSFPLDSYPNSTDLFLTTDLTAPSTSVIFSGTNGNQEWFTSPVSVTLNAVDDQSGVASTFYTLNDGPTQTYTMPFSITGTGGRFIVEYWSVDVAGNVETHKFRNVWIDFIAPATQAINTPLEFDVGLLPIATATADLNNDAHLDILTANRNSSTVSLLFGDGTGQLGNRRDLVLPEHPIDVLAGDFNNDGNQDVAAIGESPSTSGWLFLGNGTGGFGSRRTFSAGSFMNSFTSADLDRDGNLDLVIGKSGTFAIVLFGNGAGGFTSTNLTTGFSAPLCVATADFNRDGSLDVVIGHHESQIVIMFGDGTGGFASPVLVGAAGSASRQVAATDLNNDGNTDIVTSNPSTLYIFLGAGDGTFSSAIAKDFHTGGDKPFAIGDFNDDGICDVVLADTSFDLLHVLLGAGDGNVNLEATISVAAAPRGVMTGDFNEDGISDIGLVRLDPAGFSTLPGKVVVFVMTDLIVPSTSIISSPITVRLNASDHGSGVASTFYTINGGPAQIYTTALSFTNDSVYTIEFWSTDVAGNTETHKTRTVGIDSTAPNTQAFVSGTAGTNGWYRSDLQVSLNATDNVAGVLNTFYRIDGGATQTYAGPFVISALGQHTVEYWSVDNLNHIEATQLLAVNIDTIAPVVTASANPSTAPKKPQPVTVTISGSVTDSLSGVSGASFNVIDEYGATQPNGPVSVQANGSYSFTLTLQATKQGSDKDGHVYTIVVSGFDQAGNSGAATTTLRIN